MNGDNPYTIDIFIARRIDQFPLEDAITRAFDLTPNVARYAPYASDIGMQFWNQSETGALVQLADTWKGDFPAQYLVTFKRGKPDKIIDRLGRLSAQLGTAFITSVNPETPSEFEYRLAAPDGSVSIVMLDESAYDDDEMKLSAADARHLEESIVRADHMALAG